MGWMDLKKSGSYLAPVPLALGKKKYNDYLKLINLIPTVNHEKVGCPSSSVWSIQSL